MTEPEDTIIPVYDKLADGVDWMTLTCGKCGHVSKIGTPTARTPKEDDAALVERVARAICKASGDTWKTGTYEVMDGPNWSMQPHPLDPFNNHWRAKADAAIAAIQSRGG